VLLAYSKLWLHDEMLASALPDDPWVATAVDRYFPRPLRERCAAYLPRHPLRREIISTYVVNSMVNRVGSTFVHGLMEATGARPHEIVRAFLLQREIFDYVPLWQAIEALDNQVPDETQSAMLIEAGRLTVRATLWMLRSKRLAEDVAGTIAHFRPAAQALATGVHDLLDEPSRANLDARAARFVATGVPEPLARWVASLENVFSVLDIVEVAGLHGQPVDAVASVYFRLASLLGLQWLRERIGQLSGDGHWATLARGAMRDDVSGLQRTLTADVMARADGAGAPDEMLAAWQRDNAGAIERAGHLLTELRNVPTPDLSMLSVALRELRNLA
jgi:glutamate dehydrogenase